MREIAIVYWACRKCDLGSNDPKTIIKHIIVTHYEKNPNQIIQYMKLATRIERKRSKK